MQKYAIYISPACVRGAKCDDHKSFFHSRERFSNSQFALSQLLSFPYNLYQGCLSIRPFCCQGHPSVSNRELFLSFHYIPGLGREFDHLGMSGALVDVPQEFLDVLGRALGLPLDLTDGEHNPGRPTPAY
jgi:hypothetical protein